MSEMADQTAASVSSSGYEDGLGRRTLAFERETGSILERLQLRAELRAFERAITGRMREAAAFDDERFARPLAVDHDPVSGALVVISEYVQGLRVADLLDGLVVHGSDDLPPPGLDAAFGFLIEVLPALASLHAVAGFAHGAVGAGRIVLTPAGQVVLTDWLYGQFLGRLGWDGARLWRELGLLAPPGQAPPRFDQASDVTQATVVAVMLVTGRLLNLEGGRDDLTAAVAEIVEIAQIRGSERFASEVGAFLHRGLALAGSQPFASADEATEAARSLAGTIGEPQCCAALVTFLGEFDRVRNGGPATPIAAEALDEGAAGLATGEEGSPIAEESSLTAEEGSLTAELFEEGGIPVGQAPRASEPVSPPPAVSSVPASGAPASGVSPAPPPGPASRRKRSRGGKRDRDRLRSDAAPPEPVVPTPVAPPGAPLAPSRTAAQAPATSADPVPAAPGGGPGAAPVSGPPVPAPGSVKPPSPSADRPFSPAPAPAPAAWAAAPAAPPPMPHYPSLPDPRESSPAAWGISGHAPEPAAAPGPLAAAPLAAPIRIKTQTPTSHPPPPRPRDTVSDEDVTGVPYVYRGAEPRRGSRWPWAAAAAVVAIGIAAAVARPYLKPSTSSGAGPVATSPAPRAAAAAGGLSLVTEPAGARVLIDGAPAGETPLTLDAVTPGRHTITFETAGGSVKKSVKVEAGKTTSLDVAVYSGWVAIFAPINLDVSEGGRSIGTTEQGRLMLSPGRHQLTFTNRELGYRSSQAVEIKAGEERSINLQPAGELNANALPWAEVWIDGQKAGDTPLAGLRVPLGTHEIVFRHPELGERSVTVTIRADAASTASVDFAKPPVP